MWFACAMLPGFQPDAPALGDNAVALFNNSLDKNIQCNTQHYYIDV